MQIFAERRVLFRSREGDQTARTARSIHDRRPKGSCLLPGALLSYTFVTTALNFLGQFTQILDVLQAILKMRDIQYSVLTGSTPVDVRQTLVDEFTEDPTISVFLLSTKAGGMGINLTAASVVILCVIIEVTFQYLTGLRCFDLGSIRISIRTMISRLRTARIESARSAMWK